MASSWRQSKKLFQDAIERPRESQVEFVKNRAIDGEQEAEVLRLLEQHHREDGLLESPIARHSEENHPSFAGLNQAIEGFTLKEIIGRGGMGTVFLAEQQKPERSVALKLMRADLAGTAYRQRFDNEIALLAKLHHPGIARIYQSGTVRFNSESHPWFAMEYVDGFTLSDYLKSKSNAREASSLETKISLLQQVCRAVAYAHQQGIVHRDLKPGNILVSRSTASRDTDAPQIKVVDFGIAKLHDDEPRRQLTFTHDLLGTLNYMSPESIAGSQERVDHRVDIYALGVIAFEVFSGTLPHDRCSSSFASTVKKIESEVPKRLREIDSSIPKDLELMVDKAMSTDVRLRYATVEDFLIDLQRFLDGFPVLARRPSLLYRTDRYLRRNRVVATAMVAVGLALSVGLVGSIYNARQARLAAAASSYEAEKANAINSFFTNDLLGQLLHHGLDEDSSDLLKQTIAETAQQVDSMFANRPLILAAVRNELGTIYYSMQDFEHAEVQYRLAMEIWERELGMRHPDTLKAISNLGQSQLALGSRDETERLLRLAYRLRSEVLGVMDEATLRSLNNLGDFLRRKEEFEEAERLFTEGLLIQQRFLGSGHKTTLTTAANLGSLYVSLGKLEEALTLHESSYQAAKRTLGANHSLTLQTGIRWIQTLDQAGDYEQAESELLPIIDLYEKRVDPGSGLIIPYRLLARIYRHQQRLGEAKRQLLAARAIAERVDDLRGLSRIDRDLEKVSDAEAERLLNTSR